MSVSLSEGFTTIGRRLVERLSLPRLITVSDGLASFTYSLVRRGSTFIKTLDSNHLVVVYTTFHFEAIMGPNSDPSPTVPCLWYRN